MTHVVTLALDLRRPEGRAALRAYMDAIEAAEEVTPAPPAAPPVDEVGAPLTRRTILYRAFGLDPAAPAVGEDTASPVVADETACRDRQAEPPTPEPTVKPGGSVCDPAQVGIAAPAAPAAPAALGGGRSGAALDGRPEAGVLGHA